jgi:hypothetical protein
MSYWTGGRYGYSGVEGGGIPSEKLVEKKTYENPQKLLRQELHEIARTKGVNEMLIALDKNKEISHERRIEFLRDYLDHHQIY